MIAPMLAFKWQSRKKHMPFPCHVDPKLNGVRCQYQNGWMQSRSHGLEDPKFWHLDMHQHIRAELSHVPPNIMLDGEIYFHGWSLQKINGAGGVNRLTPNDSTLQLEYHVFDCFNEDRPELQFDYRRVLLHSLMFRSPVKIVDSYLALDELMMESYFKLFRSKGYEGAMVKNSTAPYGLLENCSNKENRWNYILKRKDWLDEEFEILDFTLTVGEKGEAGFQLTCKGNNGRPSFNVGSGLSDMELATFSACPPLGRLATVKFEMYSDLGRPLKPTILLIHE